MKRVNFRLFALAIALVATSCVKDVVVDSNFHGTPSEKICFGAELKDTGEDTRGGVVSNRVGKHDLKSADGEFVLPMGVYVEDGIGCADAAETRGALFTNAGEIDDFTVWAKHEVDNKVSAYFNNVVFTKNTKDNIFYSPTGEEYMWPGDGELTFVAVTNAPESGFEPNYTAGSDGEDMLESFTYTVPADATAQNDIVLAKATYSGSTDASAPLTFSHIMSAVNVQIGAVSAGTIESITLKGVYNKGSYNVDTNRWIVDTSSTADYSVKFAGGGDSFTTTGTQTSGTAINADNATFMFIPQEPGAGAVMEIVFDNGDRTETLTGKIEGDIWDKGKTVNYKLSIDKDFTLKVEPAPTAKKLDAHYIISEVNVTVSKISSWELRAVDGAGRNVTVIKKSEANPLARQGFWTDVYVDANGVETTESARGDVAYQGSGDLTDEPFLVFIPENISEGDINISLTLKSTAANSSAESTKVLVQKCPNWVDGGFGWETVDDDEAGKYGFKWTRKIAYLYPYTRALQSTCVNYCQGIIDEYNASEKGFATVGSAWDTDWVEGGAWYEASLGYRAWILLDYSVLNNIEGANSTDKGYNNTLALYRGAGTNSTSQFETILNNLYKTETGHESEKMFRIPGQYEIDRGVPQESGVNNDLSDIMLYIQKKNRYCVQKNMITGDNTAYIYAPYFYEKDLLWYLPAKDQFLQFVPNPDVADDDKANYWSSTTAGTTTAWTGAPAELDRDEKRQVIAVRENVNNVAPATISEISTEEMKGGENGEAQWVE